MKTNDICTFVSAYKDIQREENEVLIWKQYFLSYSV